MGQPVNFAILHHKQTSALQFYINSNAKCIQNKDVLISMYRNLEKSKFSQAFLKLDSRTDSNCDYQNKFIGVKPMLSKNLIPFFSERLNMKDGSNFDSKSSNKNYIMTLGWKIHGLEDDFLIYFVQRRCYNTVTRISIVRSISLQFSTPRGLELLDKYYQLKQDEIKDFSEIDLFGATENGDNK
jgi:hypothetical protein